MQPGPPGVPAQFSLKLLWPVLNGLRSTSQTPTVPSSDIRSMISRLDIAILIACLGAGAVVAVPRHAQIATDVRLAEVTALVRAATTAAQLAHSRWLAADQPPTIDGPRGVVAMTYGYPSVGTLPLMLAVVETATFAYDGGVWRASSVQVDRACGVSYQPPVAAGQNPAISAHTSGC